VPYIRWLVLFLELTCQDSGWHTSQVFLGRLLRVDLIILVGLKCLSVHTSVRTSVRPQKVSSNPCALT